MNRGTVRFRSDVQNLFHSPGDGAISGERGCMQGCPPPPPSPAAASVRWGRHTSRVLCTTSSDGLCHPCMEISFSWRVVFGWEQPPPPHLGAPSPLCTSCSPAGHRCALSERIQPKDIQKTARSQREGRLGVWFSHRSGTQAAIDFVAPASHSSTAFCLGSE